ncbi:MAG: hypothetical protein JST89_11640 [Cyanobacteria bacterium SZAS-4]|nr:hypothetical protein [Cyanobacteria bacterium SZAS-4]
MNLLSLSLLLLLVLSPTALASDKAKGEGHVPTKKCTLQNFQLLKVGTDVKTVFKDFGEPLRDIGSGIHIYEYKLADDSIIRVGCVTTVFYVDHIQGKQNTRLAGPAIDPNAK